MEKTNQNAFTAFVITACSLFCQWLNWFAFEKLNYKSGFLFITPLILCFMYHLVQLDAGRNGNFSRKFFFMFSTAVPFAIGLILTLIMLFVNPELSLFNSDVAYNGSVQETIAVYSGRFMFTSLYMAVFAALDIPVLSYMDNHSRKSGLKK